MEPINFNLLVPDKSMTEYRNHAAKQLSGWLGPAASNASSEDRELHERTKITIERQQTAIEDLLIAIEAMNAENALIKSMLTDMWPQWAQGVIDDDRSNRLMARLAKARLNRDELEDIAINLSWQMNAKERSKRSSSDTVVEEQPTTMSSPRGSGARMEFVKPAVQESGPAGDTRALVYLNPYDKSGKGLSAQLKRMALLFDEIQYVLPDFWVITDEVLNDPSRVIRHGDGVIEIIEGLDPVRHLRPAISMPLHMLPDDLQRTLEELIESGVASEFDAYSLKSGEENTLFNRVKHRMAWEDAKDPVFRQLSGTRDGDFQTQYHPMKIEFHGSFPKGEQSEIIYVVIPPPALTDSIDLTTALYGADQNQLFPVFPGPNQRAELAHRYSQYKAGLRVLEDFAPHAVAADEFKSHFGEVAFALSNGLFASDVIEQKSVRDILRYRGAMDHARRKFISEHLATASSLVAGNPWSRETRVELEQFIRGPIASDLLAFEEASIGGWDKFFGTTISAAIEGTKRAIFGAGASFVPAKTLIGTIMPYGSAWEMAAIAGLAAGSSQSKTIVDALIERVMEKRAANRSSIAFVAKFR